MATALITGGTVGIGHSFAKILAAKGVNLVLASRDEAGLNAVAEDFRTTYAIDVEVIPTDLTGVAYQIRRFDGGAGHFVNLLTALGIPRDLAYSVLRVSLGKENTRKDIDTFISALGSLL